jgi:hypothetical protein
MPWPVSLGDTLIAATRAVTEATRNYLLALGPAIEAGAQPPPLQDLEQAFTQFATAVAAERQAEVADFMQDHGPDKTSSEVEGDAATFVSTFSFALEQVRYSLEEFAECVADMSKATQRS